MGLISTIALAAPADAATQAPQSPATPGSIGLRLLDAPLSAGSDPRAGLYIVDRMAPGAVIHRRIEVSNTALETAHIALYSAAATLGTGSFVIAPGHTANELSTWTSVRPGVLDVAAGVPAIAVVTVKVPRDASPGERYGVVWAEVSSRTQAQSGVLKVSRVGIRLYVSIGPGGAPAADFRITSLTAGRTAGGLPRVVATVHNSGGRALDMSGSLTLAEGPDGLGAGPFPATMGTTLAIGDSEPVTITMGRQLPAGPWLVRVTLRSGLVEHQVHATLTFPAAGEGRQVAVLAPRHRWVLPLLVGLSVVLLLALTYRAFRGRRRGSHSRRRGGDSTRVPAWRNSRAVPARPKLPSGGLHVPDGR